VIPVLGLGIHHTYIIPGYMILDGIPIGGFTIDIRYIIIEI
jgi:hypothetical protein